MTLKNGAVEVLGDRICEQVIGGAVENADDAVRDAIAKGHDTKINMARARLDRIFAQQTACANVLVKRCR